MNRSDRAGTVSIAAYDDGGNSFGPVTLSLDALQTVHFNSVELEDGEASKGLPEGTGAPSRGDWWLELSSELDINVLSYIRTPGGFVTSMHDVVPRDTNTYHVAFFNPGSNTAQESLLRLVNPGDDDVSVTIRGIDDQGDEAPGGAVSLTLPSRASRTVTAMDLEVGAADLEGSLGDGAGKWRFALAADRTIMAISMLSTPTGHLTNLSTDPGLGGEPASVERLPAPVIEVTGTREFAFSWTWSAQAGETYAFDYGPRFNGGEWVEECAAVSYSETLEDTIRVTYTTTQDLVAGTVIEARYRYRNSSSCESGSPGSWSHIGSATVAGGGETQLPDLVVESTSILDDSLDVNETFTFNVAVHNRGDGQSTATTLRYYRSSNSLITNADTEEGTDTVDALAADATIRKSISIATPSSSGTYFYGACVDSVSGESDTTNNCSIGVRVTVVDSSNAGAPDLIVESVSIVDRTLVTGEMFTLKATIRNQGDGRSRSTTLRYYRSTNSRISSVDTEIGTDSIGDLEYATSSDSSSLLTAPSSAGTYYYGACVDTVTGESDTSNNCSIGIHVVISEPMRADACSVNLERSTSAHGIERITFTSADATSVEVSTVKSPFIVSAGLDSKLDHDIYTVTLEERSRLRVRAMGDLDTEAVAVTNACTEFGFITSDVSSLPDVTTSDSNFLLSADLDAGTYFVVVFEWNSRVGDYSLEFALDDEVSHKPNFEHIQNQELIVGDSATVFVPVVDADDDLQYLTVFSENPESINALIHQQSEVWRIELIPVAAGSGTIHVSATDRRGQVGLTFFEVAVHSSTSAAPKVNTGEIDGQLIVNFQTTLNANEIRAYDLELRSKKPQLPWQNIGCVKFENPASNRVSEDLRFVVNGLRLGVSVDARYRSRNSESCDSRNTDPWSALGSGIVAGSPINEPPAFDDAEPIERSITENAPGGLNTGAPVVAYDPDGIRDELVYSLGGPDLDSFVINPSTGQIRTRQEVIYDYETKPKYQVEVEAIDVYGKKDSAMVTIAIDDLDANCAVPENVRLNAGDGRLWARWTPVAQDSDFAAVLGYQIEYRAESATNWSRLDVGARNLQFIEIPGLINDLRYSVRVRTSGSESECEWSPPIIGTPTTDIAPKDSLDFSDRFERSDRLGPWTFPVPGRCAEHHGEQLDCSYKYEKTSPDRATITLEYDDGRPSCTLSLLFSSITAGSYIDECGDAGVRVPFEIAPLEPEMPLAPQNVEQFNKLVFGNRSVLPGFEFGQYFPTGNKLCDGPIKSINGNPPCEPAHSGVVAIPGSSYIGRYKYEVTGTSTAQLDIEISEESDCINWEVGSCEDLESDRTRVTFELKFETSTVATFTATICITGQACQVDYGTLDFEDGSNEDHLPHELIPPQSPPQERGSDHSGVAIATPVTTPTIAGDTQQSVLVRDSGVLPVNYRSGDWLEPKDGSNQRMMIAGTDHGTASVASVGQATSFSLPFTSHSNVEPEFIRLAVICMQQDNNIPVRGSRFFSRPRIVTGPVQSCQRDCVLKGSKTMQACVWDCEDSSFESEMGIAQPEKSLLLAHKIRSTSVSQASSLETANKRVQDMRSYLTRPHVPTTVYGLPLASND